MSKIKLNDDKTKDEKKKNKTFQRNGKKPPLKCITKRTRRNKRFSVCLNMLNYVDNEFCAPLFCNARKKCLKSNKQKNEHQEIKECYGKKRSKYSVETNINSARDTITAQLYINKRKLFFFDCFLRYSIKTLLNTARLNECADNSKDPKHRIQAKAVKMKLKTR